jgi:hypothetical protein
MVGHEVEDQPEPGALERGTQPREGFLAAELRIERAIIHRVIAVPAARPRFQKRRHVEMRDAKRLQIRHDPRGIVEAEIFAELKTIGGEGRVHGTIRG